MSTKRYVMVIDQERCIGCEACTVACNNENTAYRPLINVEVKMGGKFPESKMEFMPHLCNQCTRPLCVEICPTEALTKREDGIVVLNEEDCNGCRMCTDVCPYSAIHFNRDKGVVEKCNFCAPRIDKGLEPFCVICCEGQALHFGDLNDPNSEVSKIIAERDTFQLKTEKNTGPSIYYCPPKPRSRL
ncbi:MAG: 4Fe-4S dicluster domain-containing protein [Promethearchaeota archaeon]